MASIEEIPLAARVLLEDVYESTGHPAHDWWHPSWTARVNDIASRYNLDGQAAADYLQRVAKLFAGPGWGRKSVSTTIFVEDEKWNERQPCVGFRRGGMYLPRHTFAIGFISQRKGLLASAKFDTDEQHKQFIEVVTEALIQAGDMQAERDAQILITTGFVEFKYYGGLPKFHRPSLAR